MDIAVRLLAGERAALARAITMGKTSCIVFFQRAAADEAQWSQQTRTSTRKVSTS
jgi:hypothetical protein